MYTLQVTIYKGNLYSVCAYMCVYVCVCVYAYVCVCVRVCVCEREREAACRRELTSAKQCIDVCIGFNYTC